MKSKRNLTRFTYDTTAFQGWRLCLSRAGTTFTKYFSDKKYGGPKKSLTAAEDAPRGKSVARFYGTASIGGKVVTQPGHLASMAWPIRAFDFRKAT